MSAVVSEWDAKFVDVEQELLFELILAANFMDIKSLMELTCAKVATTMKVRPQRRRWFKCEVVEWCVPSFQVLYLTPSSRVGARHRTERQTRFERRSVSRTTFRRRRRSRYSRRASGVTPRSCF